MAPTTLPTRVLAGVTVPDTPLITKALEYTRQYSTPDTYNHIVRSFLLGFIIADKVLPDRDCEAHALAAIMHDLGFPLGHPPNSDIITTEKRFEVDGANAARRFLQREAPAEEWDKHRLQLVWDAIALHTIGSIVFEKEPEVQACSYGIWADFQGPDRVPGGLLTWEEYNAVVAVSTCDTFHIPSIYGVIARDDLDLVFAGKHGVGGCRPKQARRSEAEPHHITWLTMLY
jgi:hypothetical protein